MVEEYVSVRATASAEVDRKKSRFIGIAAQAESEEQAEGRIEEARGLYPDASHHCFAYCVGLEGVLTRFSDDKEPQGTAGRPILDVIEKNGLANVCVVVVRYFGGTQLGAGGLARAYRAAAVEAVEKAGITRYTRHTIFAGRASYAEWSKMESALQQFGVSSIVPQYLEVVRFSATIESDRFEEIREAITDKSAGAVRLAATGTTFLATAKH